MSKEVWKFGLSVGHQEIEMPADSELLSVQVQNGLPCLWAVVDPSAPKAMVRFRVHGTGHPLEEDIDEWIWLGTFQMHGGGLVFHVFFHEQEARLPSAGHV